MGRRGSPARGAGARAIALLAALALGALAALAAGALDRHAAVASAGQPPATTAPATTAPATQTVPATTTAPAQPPASTTTTTPAPPANADVLRTPIPRWVAPKRRAWPFRVSTAHVPPGVDPARFVALVRAAGVRWGLPFAGTTRRAPHADDGRNTIGFSRGVSRDALGVTDVQSIVYQRRGRLHCRRDARGRRVCRRARPRVVGERVVEQDTRFAYDVPWEPGPALPDAAHYDLQTVILHELGHYAGNGHAPDCRDTPMWVALARGEWWHSPSDWFQHGCGRVAAIGLAHAAGTVVPEPRRLLVRRHVRYVTVR